MAIVIAPSPHSRQPEEARVAGPRKRGLLGLLFAGSCASLSGLCKQASSPGLELLRWSFQAPRISALRRSAACLCLEPEPYDLRHTHAAETASSAKVTALFPPQQMKLILAWAQRLFKGL